MSVAGKISVGYFVLGVIYIALSDLLMGLYHGHDFFDNIPVLNAGILKGWVFFLVTAVILYIVFRRFLKRLQDQRHLFDSIVNNTNDWLWLIDRNARLLMANRTLDRKSVV